MSIFRSRKFEGLPDKGALDYPVAVLEQKIRQLVEDIEYTKNKYTKASEEAVLFQATIIELTNQKTDLEAALEKLK